MKTDLKAANQVAILSDSICAEIERRGLAEGDLFGTEADICERYGISRSVVREAVSRLQELGVLQPLRRKGLMVASPNPMVLLRRSFAFYGRSPKHFRDVAQARFAIEVGAVDIAAANATPQQLRQLQSLEKEYALAVSENAPGIMIVFIDSAFHSTILEMTGNPLIAGMHYVLEEYFRQWKEKREERLERMDSEERAQELKRSVWAHRTICEALSRRDAESARAFLRSHLAQWLMTPKGGAQPPSTV